MQGALQEELLCFRQVDPTEWSFGEGVRRDQSQAVNPDLMYAVNRLQGRGEGTTLGQVLPTSVRQTRRPCQALPVTRRSTLQEHELQEHKLQEWGEDTRQQTSPQTQQTE